jgi:iron complex outermembrane recepter protein
MFNITPEYTNGKFYANLTWSYLGAREANFANAFKLPAFSQFSLAMGYDVSKKVRISANINNLFNKYGVMGWLAPGTFPNNTNLEGLSNGDVKTNGNVFYETIGIPARAYFVTATFRF